MLKRKHTYAFAVAERDGDGEREKEGERERAHANKTENKNPENICEKIKTTTKTVRMSNTTPMPAANICMDITWIYVCACIVCNWYDHNICCHADKKKCMAYDLMLYVCVSSFVTYSHIL